LLSCSSVRYVLPQSRSLVISSRGPSGEAAAFSPSSRQQEQSTGLVADLERMHECRGPYDHVLKPFSLPAAVNMYLGQPVLTVQPGGCSGSHNSTSDSHCAGCARAFTAATINQAFAEQGLGIVLRGTDKSLSRVWCCGLQLSLPNATDLIATAEPQRFGAAYTGCRHAEVALCPPYGRACSGGRAVGGRQVGLPSGRAAIIISLWAYKMG
jgi:hypothetical protein